MRKLITLGLFTMLALVPALSSAADRVGDFTLLDQQGYSHTMSWYDDHAAIAFLIQANGTVVPTSTRREFAALQTRFDDQGIEFFMLNPTGTQDRASVIADMGRHGSNMAVLIDDTQLISEALGVDKAGEVFLFDPKTFTVEFRGPVGAEFEAALVAKLAGQPIANPVVATTGEAIAFPARDAHDRVTPSYETEIAPLILENCASCHHEGAVGPFAMDSHSMMQAWSPMIREVLMTKRMPPGQIDPHIGDFVNDGLVGDSNVQKILHWIAAGSPRDGDSDPLADKVWPATKWAFGEPDYIIKIPPKSIPATGEIPYLYDTTAAIDIGKDRWVRASQYIAGDPGVLHHTLHRIIPPENAGQGRGYRNPGAGDTGSPGLSPYVPGAEPRMNPPNTGGLLRDGSELAVQLHYTANGQETVDAGEIGVWFYPEGEVPEERMSGQCACIFTPTWTDIPAHDPDFVQTSSITLTGDVELYSFLSHMHFRGKYMRFYADYPDGTSEELINIAKYDYAWQWAYTYEEPKFMPAGTVLTAVGGFDNSAQNPSNPDPTIPISWGQQSWDEMFFGAMQWKEVNR
ncbi:MAG TPA: hypothetical protein DCM64_12985 [Gammaproteobacteria bacterium]|jgi:peroxiredoxin|nr:redoxin domain-containing protein [Gammaproteobacteria bacterium]HAJ77352.1 hypothetical protein [Gammaproteobacteria bacterium]